MTIELTPKCQLKAKAFAPYLGVAWVHYNRPGFEGSRAAILYGFDLEKIYNNKEPYARLSLRHISAIRDEEAIDIAKIQMPGASDIKIERNKHWIRVLANQSKRETEYIDISLKEWDNCGWNNGLAYEDQEKSSLSHNCYQYLQSKGYDLPQYILGDKTIEEMGRIF